MERADRGERVAECRGNRKGELVVEKRRLRKRVVRVIHDGVIRIKGKGQGKAGNRR